TNGWIRATCRPMRSGHRQSCFVTGEPGIGKTTLVDSFLDELGPDATAVRGQCVEQYGAPEAYLAVIQLLGQLRRSDRGDEALAALVRYAPTVLAQLPQLVPDDQLADVQRRAAGGSETKLVRELIEAIQALCNTGLLVIVLEDLQWSDLRTLDLVSALGQRRDRAKLLVIGTSRRAEAQTVSHPLNRVMREMTARGGATAIPLDRIDATDIAALVDARFPGHALPPAFVEVVDRITGGTPLFACALLDDLEARGMLARQGGAWGLAVSIDELAAHRPDSVRQLIDIQLDRLVHDEQRVLEVAGLIGLEVPTALVAATLELPIERVDELCDGLARRGLFLRHAGTEDWPDGSLQSRYGFTHGLVQEVCIERTSAARRQRWHRAVAEHLERAYGDRAPEIASSLASHYDQGRDLARAVHFHALAAGRMAQRFANADALVSYRRALALIERMPASAERDGVEMRVRSAMASSMLRNRFEAGETIAQFERVIELARKAGDLRNEFAALAGLSVRLSTLARYAEAIEVMSQSQALMEARTSLTGTPGSQASWALPLFWQGRLRETIDLLAPITTPEATPEEDVDYSILEPRARNIVLIGYIGVAYWLAGRPERGLRELERATAQAVRDGDPYPLGNVATHLARIRYLAGAPVHEINAPAQLVLANPDAEVWHAQASMIITCTDSLAAPLSEAAVARLLAQFRERVVVFPMGATYAAVMVIHALIRSQAHREATALTDDMLAFARAHGERIAEAELIRCRGELLAHGGDPVGAEAAYREAIAIATAGGAWSLALRAALSLGDPSALAAILPHFGDGAGTRDVIAATAQINAGARP
ncbi:MAG TPA: AAA family ATPase, partial [Kofleriaceae bacterium]|nr:AAA family ATPase [Kofleriaceae bacterium]